MFWNNYRYEIENGEAVILEYVPESAEGHASDGEDGISSSGREIEEQKISIPAEIDGYPVTKIGEAAFSEHGFEIESIEVPETVKIIGDYAFKMCMSLAELILHEGLVEIGKGVLDVTSMTKIHIPSTVKHMARPYELGEFLWDIDERNPFYHTDGYGLYYIREHSGICNPAGVDNFCAAAGEDSLYAAAGTDNFCAAAGADSFCTAEEANDFCCAGAEKNGYKVLTAIQKQDERIEYEVEEGTTEIGCNAFEGQMHLQKVILPETVAVVGEDAFESCQNLKEVTLPEGLREIRADVFRHCVKLNELRLPSSLSVLGERAVTDTFGWSDRMNGITRITVAEGNPVFEADENALYRKEADGSVTLIKYFGREREFEIPEKVFRIGESAFRRANVRNLVIPQSVAEIGGDAFRECKNLESIYIGADQVPLYVPRTPVYRKDEVAAPLYRKDEVAAPLYRKDEVAASLYRKKRSCGDIREDAAINAGNDREKRPLSGYDYSKYDGLIKTWSQILERCRMACFRLKYPLELDSETQSEYRKMILDHMTEVLVDISDREDIGYLADLANAGVFTVENIDAAIDVVSRCRKAKLTGYLMNYKQEHLGLSEFDFDL